MRKTISLLLVISGMVATAADLLSEQWSQLKTENGIVRHDHAKLLPGSYAAMLRKLPAQPGKKLVFQAELRTPKPLSQGVYRLQIAFFDARGGLTDIFTSPQSLRCSKEWCVMPYVFRVPAGVKTMQLRLLHNAAGCVEIRSIRLFEPEKGSFLALLAPDYAGTMEEKKILHDWSLKSSGMDAPAAYLDYQDKPEGVSFSIVFARKSIFENSTGATVESIVEDPRPAPAPLREISKITLALKCFHAKGKGLRLAVRLAEPHSGWGGQKNYHTAELPLTVKPEWQKIELPSSVFRPEPGRWGKADWKLADGMYFYLSFTGQGELGVKLADVTIHYKDGSCGRPFQAWKDPFWYFPAQIDRKIQLTVPPRAAVHGSGIYLLDSERGRTHFQSLQKLLPSFSIQSNVYLRNLIAARPWLKAHGMGAGYQNASPYLWQAATELDALAVPLESYTMLNERHHKMDYTSERWNSIWREVAKRFGRCGIPEYQSIDSNFRVVPAQVDRHTGAILNETDGGILLNSGRRIHFWDYFKSYTGRKWSPAELNYRTWDEHRTEPVNLYAFAGASPLQRKKGYLDMAIRHYAFVRFESGASQEFAKYQVRFFLMNNGDDWRNGNDFIWNLRSLKHGGFVDENYFYHPRTCLKAFHLGLQNRAARSGNDVQLRLIGESGKGGHGPIYWDPKFSYAALFAICAATRYDSFEMDWPSEELLENLPGSDTLQQQRFRDYYCKNLAYRHATGDFPLQPLIPLDRVISLQETRVMYAGEHHRKMSRAAEQNSLPVSRLAPLLFQEKTVGKCTLLINDCYALPEGMAERLLQFLRNGSRRALLLHGVSAARKIDGTMWSEAFGWDKTSINAPDQFGSVLGKLTFRNGRTYPEKRGKRIFKDSAGDVLLYYPVSNTAGIYYYTCTPGLDPKRDVRILKAVMSRRGIASPLGSSGDSLYVRAYRDRNHCIYAVFDKPSLDNYRWTYSAEKNGCYPWRNPGGKHSETVHAPTGKYLLFGMLSGTETPVTVGPDRKLVLTLKDHTAEIFHLIPAEDRETLERIRRQHREIFSSMTQLQKVPPMNFSPDREKDRTGRVPRLPDLSGRSLAKTGAVTGEKVQIPDFRETPEDKLRLLAVAENTTRLTKVTKQDFG